MTEEDRYFSRVDDYDLLLSAVLKNCTLLSGSEVSSDRQSYASIVHDKIVAHAVSLSKIIPRRHPSPASFWDLSSVSALARCVMDGYHTLAYLSLDEIGDDEHQFRCHLLSLHDVDRRLQIARSMSSGLETIEALERQMIEVREHLSANSFFSALSEKQRADLLKKPPDLHGTRSVRNRAAQVSDEFYFSALVYLSQFVHTHGFAINQLFAFTARSEESCRAMIIPVTFAMAFLARATQDVARLFGIKDEDLAIRERTVISEYSMMTNGYGATQSDAECKD